MSSRPATSRKPTAAARPKPAKNAKVADRVPILLLVPVATLVIVGLGAMLSASSVIAFRETGDRLYYFKRQLMWTGVGVGALLVTAKIPFDWYRRLAVPLYGLAVGGLIAVLAVGVEDFGATRWIQVGPVTVQPSEFAKFATIVFLSTVMARKEKWLHEFPHFIWPVVGSIGLVGLLIMAQPDLGTTILIAVAGLAVLVASRAPLRFVASTAAVGGLLAVALAYAAPYRWARVTGFLDPLADRLGDGLQATQSLVALSTGGWFGVGLGASRARWSFLPNAHTDFIFAIIGEEMGFAGALVVVLLFVAFGLVGTLVALRANDRFAKLLAIGIVTWLSVQALVNIGGVTVVLPITGVPLPFVSAGGSAMVVNLAAVGVLINIARTAGR